MATCNYTLSFTVPIPSPTTSTVQLILQTSGLASSDSYGPYNYETVGATSVEGIITDAIEDAGGTVTTCEITYDSGTTIATYNIAYSYEDITEGVLTGIGIEALFFAGAETICEEEVCPEPEPDPITQCAECISVERAACAAAYTFTAGLTASTDYVAVLSDHFGRQYTQDITTGVDGDFTIDATGDFPLGFWTPENSPIEIWVRESVNDTNEAITVSSVEYPCIKLNLVYRDDANPIVLTMFITTDYGIPITNDSGEELLDE